MLKSIIVSIHLQIVCNHILKSIVMPHNIDGVHNSKLSAFREDFVVMTRY